MKSKKIIFLEKILKFLAVRTLRKFHPRIVGVTGSIGKSSTKEAIFTVLSSKFRVRKNEKNYNNEIGLPLTILGLESGEGSFGRWLVVLLRAASVAFLSSSKSYPEILVVELGADRPGDIKYLVDFLKPDVGVVTNVGISHMEFFKNRKSIAREKGYLVRGLGKGGLAVLNFDDKEVRGMAGSLKVKKISYGFSEDSDIRASDIFFGYEKSKDQFGGDISKIRGVSFKLSYEGTTLPVRLTRSVGQPQISAVLAAVAVGIHFDMNLVEIADAVKNFRAPVGRLNLIDGIKNTVIIEDSYNAAPQSALAALEVLEKIKARRKIAALGDMLELGEETEKGHREVGRRVAEVADILITVGEKSKFIADEAESAGLDPVRNSGEKQKAETSVNLAKHGLVSNGVDKNKIFCYNTSLEARIPIQNELREGDVILIKGSQGARMELISKEIMKNPEKAEKLLPRQSAEWK